MRLNVERLGTALVVLMTIVTLVGVCAYVSLKETVADLHAQSAILRGDPEQPSRSPLGARLQAVLASDVAPSNAAALDERGLALDHRADRLLEATAVVALVGMLVALLNGRPAVEVASARDDRIPLASTSSNGTV